MLGVAANPAPAQQHPQDQHHEHQILQDASHVPVQVISLYVTHVFIETNYLYKSDFVYSFNT